MVPPCPGSFFPQSSCGRMALGRPGRWGPQKGGLRSGAAECVQRPVSLEKGAEWEGQQSPKHDKSPKAQRLEHKKGAFCSSLTCTRPSCCFVNLPVGNF